MPHCAYTLLLSLGLVCLGGCPAPETDPGPDTTGSNSAQKGPSVEAVRAELEALATGTGDLATFSVTYDDLHGFHGGLRLTVNGEGLVTQEAKRVEVGEPRTVPIDEVRALAGLLLELEAWEQREPPRAAVPDESKAQLRFVAGGTAVTIWEWHNDLASNTRILRVADRLRAVAWTAK